MSDKQGWTAGPQDRGTFDILWTCLSTLALCVWTAVHPNILRVPNSKRSLLSRLGMMVIAIVFPEIIISAAWRQLRSSRWLRTKFNSLDRDGVRDHSPEKAIPSHHHTRTEEAAQRGHPIHTNNQEHQQALLPRFQFESVSEDVVLHPLGSSRSTDTKEERGPQNVVSDNKTRTESIEWSSKQAFFAVMGGFAIENDYVNKSNTRVTIRKLVTVKGVLQLAKLGLIPAIRPEDIEERSKADIIAKIFVLSQITWFGLQVIGRLASKIPVTPLEIHTAVHVACTIVMYLLWLEKPYDVRESVLLSTPDAKDMGALFNFYKITSKLHARDFAAYESVRVSYWNDRVVRAANNLLDYDPPPTPPVREALTKAVERYSLCSNEELVSARNAEEHILMSLAPSALRGIEILRKRGGFSHDSAVDTQNWDLLRDSSENFAIKVVWGGWSTDTGHEMSLDKGVHFLFNLLYGAGHLAAWASSSFPTSLERWFWRGAAIMLTSIPLWGILWVLWWKAARSKRRELYLIQDGDLDIVAAPFFFVIILAYFLARCYFLVESLISLRLLPAGAFLTVSWTRYLPHVA